MAETNNTFNEYHDAAEASLENADDLLNLAEYALKSGISGHAVALAITANEEIAKAFGCYLFTDNDACGESAEDVWRMGQRVRYTF